MEKKTAFKVYSSETSTNSLIDFFKDKYNAAVATELRIRNLLDQLKGECEDLTLFQFFKTDHIDSVAYNSITVSNTELLHK